MGDEVEFAPQWLQFSQQVGTKKSVVDGYISQDSLKIAVETKRGSSFSSDQLKRHLTVFRDEQHKLLILLSPSVDNSAQSELAEVVAQAHQQGVQLIHVSFRQLIKHFRDRLSDHDEDMYALIDDFESFCTEENLLPSADYTMFVPPCGKSLADNLDLHLYYCPASWNRRPADYLGIYKDRRVQAIGRISKIVQCVVNIESATVEVVNGNKELTKAEENRIIQAARKAPQKAWDITLGHRFYLCDDWALADFKKTTAGGIMGHRYFDLRDYGLESIPKTVGQIAVVLSEHDWQ